MNKMLKKLVCLICVVSLGLANVSLSFASEGEQLSGAANMGQSGTMQGMLTYEDDEDYYRYNVSGESSIRLNLKVTTNAGSIKICVLDKDGTEFEYAYFLNSSQAGQMTKNVEILLNPGSYYIAVTRPVRNEGSYTISYTTEKLHNTDYMSDDTIGTAHQLPLSTTVNGMLSGFCGDEKDFYRLNVEKAGTFKYKLKFYMERLKVRLHDEDGNQINSWYFEDNNNLNMGVEEFGYSLEPGTYYLEFEDNYYDGTYNFTQTYTDIGSSEKEPNNSLDTAQQLSLGKKVNGMVAVNKDTDFYCIKVPTKKNVTFTIPSNVKKLNMYLYDSFGNEVKRAYSKWNSNTQRGTLKEIYKLSSGTYYIQVKSSSGYDGTYTLTAAATKAPSAARITTLKRTTKSYSGYRRIYLKWNKSTNAEGYQIYVAGNSRFKDADKYTTDKRSYTTLSYKSGRTYYVKVRGYIKNSEGQYIYGKFSSVRKIRL